MRHRTMFIITLNNIIEFARDNNTELRIVFRCSIPEKNKKKITKNKNWEIKNIYANEKNTDWHEIRNEFNLKKKREKKSYSLKDKNQFRWLKSEENYCS